MSLVPPPPPRPSASPEWSAVQPGPWTSSGPTPHGALGCLLRGVGCLPLLWGVLLLVGGVTWASLGSVPAGWQTTSGAVTSFRALNTFTNLQGTTYIYLADVGYVVEGHAYRTDTGAQSQTRPSIGDRMTLAYDPRNPSDAKVVDAPGQNEGTTLFFVGGAVGTLLGLFLIVVGPVRIFQFIERRLTRR